MEDGKLVKMFDPTLKMRETILFFLIVVINSLTWIVSDITFLLTQNPNKWTLVSKENT